MFFWTLKQSFSQLGFTKIKVARCGGLDASLISRFRTGTRVPSSGSRQVEALCRGIVLLAQEQCKIEMLCDICSFARCEAEQVINALELWLSAEDAGLKARRSGKCTTIASVAVKQGFFAFSQKLDALMSAFEITNIRLAKALHIDASLISRFRTGVRSPAAGSWFPR